MLDWSGLLRQPGVEDLPVRVIPRVLPSAARWCYVTATGRVICCRTLLIRGGLICCVAGVGLLVGECIGEELIDPGPLPIPVIPRTIPVLRTDQQTQTCSDDRLEELSRRVHDVCDKNRSCRTGMPNPRTDLPGFCRELEQRMLNGQLCLSERLRRSMECFGGTMDDEHRDQYEDVSKVLDTCRAMWRHWRTRGC